MAMTTVGRRHATYRGFDSNGKRTSYMGLEPGDVGFKFTEKQLYGVEKEAFEKFVIDAAEKYIDDNRARVTAADAEYLQGMRDRGIAVVAMDKTHGVTTPRSTIEKAMLNAAIEAQYGKNPLR